jgi:hypothetical protein
VSLQFPRGLVPLISIGQPPNSKRSMAPTQRHSRSCKDINFENADCYYESDQSAAGANVRVAIRSDFSPLSIGLIMAGATTELAP